MPSLLLGLACSVLWKQEISIFEAWAQKTLNESKVILPKYLLLQFSSLFQFHLFREVWQLLLFSVPVGNNEIQLYIRFWRNSQSQLPDLDMVYGLVLKSFIILWISNVKILPPSPFPNVFYNPTANLAYLQCSRPPFQLQFPGPHNTINLQQDSPSFLLNLLHHLHSVQVIPTPSELNLLSKPPASLYNLYYD